MGTSQSPDIFRVVSRQLHFGCKNLPLQDHIKVLGISVDHSLRFDHVRIVARQASSLSLAYSLKSRAIPRSMGNLHSLQCTNTILSRAVLNVTYYSLHSEPRRSAATTTASDGRHGINGAAVCHHDVAGTLLVVHHKARLRTLILLLRAGQRCTKTALTSDQLLERPRSHSWRTNASIYSGPTHRWNTFTAATPRLENINAQHVKVAAHKWHEGYPSALVIQM